MGYCPTFEACVPDHHTGHKCTWKIGNESYSFETMRMYSCGVSTDRGSILPWKIEIKIKFISYPTPGDLEWETSAHHARSTETDSPRPSCPRPWPSWPRASPWSCWAGPRPGRWTSVACPSSRASGCGSEWTPPWCTWFETLQMIFQRSNCVHRGHFRISGIGFSFSVQSKFSYSYFFRNVFVVSLGRRSVGRRNWTQPSILLFTKPP